jgi:3-oxoacyl-[acyl-carrier protein] reductase
MPQQAKRTVVVTGGSRGLGKAICLAFAAPDTHIYFNYYPEDPAVPETEHEITATGAAVDSALMNVASTEEVENFFKKIVADTGRIDVLVNNAGITRDGLLVRMKEKDWDAVIDVNLKGTFNCTQAVSKIMMKQRYGRIINVASVVGVIGNPGQANYAASKAGIIGLTKSVAKELASRNITINAIAPGFFETEMTAVLPDKAKEAMLNMIPLGRAGKPEEVAALVEFLASEKAAYITGQVVHLSGGMYI